MLLGEDFCGKDLSEFNIIYRITIVRFILHAPVAQFSLNILGAISKTPNFNAEPLSLRKTKTEALFDVFSSPSALTTAGERGIVLLRPIRADIKRACYWQRQRNLVAIHNTS